MSDQDDDRELQVKREIEVFQKETLTVKSKRGTGTNDRDEVRKHVEREAELDVPDELLDQFPSLIGPNEEGKVVSEVVQTMNNLRESSNAE